ncbi:hypothetical protein CPB85DRAFT_35151 [Mucidula mucida]|nr:hypothetical protein CPB85DRAFT_35151 [Mucidula mucida]
MAVSTSVSAAVAQAVSFLTRPLIRSYSAATLGKLQLVLEANLTAHYAPTWSPNAPLSGSGRRCLTLTQDCLPPRVIYSACLAAGVQWFDWVNLLGIHEFDLFVDPGCVYIRVGNEILNVWAHEMAATRPSSIISNKTVAQQLLENDADNSIFDLIANEVSAPTWMTPITAKFPAPRSSSPLSTLSSHSRCSSRSSNSSSGFSVSSNDSDYSASTSTSASSKQFRREKVKTTRVFVDTSKTDVTPYDGGKTTVLTGGVMLGGGPCALKSKHAKAPSGSWRTVRI